MNITKSIIIDLLPAYLSNECSEDTKKLVEEYAKADPEFIKEIAVITENNFVKKIPNLLDTKNEREAFTKTQQLIKRRTYFMGFAIFCSFMPFSVLHIQKTTYWLLIENPYAAATFAFFGILFWSLYFSSKKKLQGL